MTQQEYLEKSKELDDKKQAIYREMKELDKAYIESNMSFPIGSEVEFKGEKGVVTGYKVSWRNVVPILMKLKKDGTISQRSLYVYGSEKMVLTGKMHELPSKEGKTWDAPNEASWTIPKP